MRGLMQGSLSVNSSWQNVLASPPRASHILQLYDSDDFLSAAVAHFAAAGLRAEEVVLLTGTKDHLARIERDLRADRRGHAGRRAQRAAHPFRRA